MAEHAFPVPPIPTDELGTYILARPDTLMVGDILLVREHEPVVGKHDDGTPHRAMTVVEINGKKHKVTFQKLKVTMSEVTRVTDKRAYTSLISITVNGRAQTVEVGKPGHHDRFAGPNHKKLIYRDTLTGPEDRSVDILEHSRLINCARFKELVDTAVAGGLEVEDVFALICETPPEQRYTNPEPTDRQASLWVRGLEEPLPWAWKVMKDIASRPEAYLG